MHIAFYAPMKPPTHATPSGDRRMARLLMRAWEISGHRVELASSFRSYDRGDARRQLRLKNLGERLADRLIRRYQTRPVDQRPKAWFTYHLYHKAPDWVGPRVSDALSIPYMVAEASYAPKQANSVWKLNHNGVGAAISKADLIIGFNPDDAACLSPLVQVPAQQITLPPFIDAERYHLSSLNRTPYRHALAKRYGLNQNVPWLLCVAMMRNDQKRNSYEVLAQALGQMRDQSWHLLVAGSGPAERPIKTAFDALKGRVTWMGAQDENALSALYGASDVFVWPAIKEAYGMVFLEALSAGLPVVAGHSAGVASIVGHNRNGLLVPQGDPAAFADATTRLLHNTSLRTDMSKRAQEDMLKTHSLDHMGATLNQLLERVMAGEAA